MANSTTGITNNNPSISNNITSVSSDVINVTTVLPPSFILVPTPNGSYEFLRFFAAIGTAGVVINGFALVIIYRYTNIWQKTKFYLLVNQIVLDFVSSLFIALQHFTTLNGDPATPRFNLRMTNQALCSWWYSLAFMWTVINASNCNIVLVTFERYVKILHPWTYDALSTKVSVVRDYFISSVKDICKFFI